MLNRKWFWRSRESNLRHSKFCIVTDSNTDSNYYLLGFAYLKMCLKVFETNYSALYGRITALQTQNLINDYGTHGFTALPTGG